MLNNNRPSIFMPFDALKGFKEQITEQERKVIDKKDLDPNKLEELDYKLNQLKVGMMISCIFFDVDEYVLVEGLVSKLDYQGGYIYIVKKRISISDIYDIYSDDIKDFNED